MRQMKNEEGEDKGVRRRKHEGKKEGGKEAGRNGT